MHLKFETIDGTLITHIEGELDHHAAEEIRTEIDRKIDQQGIKNLLFDLKGMNFMDSSGIGLVIGRYKRVNKIGGQVAVIHMNKRIERIFKMSGLLQLVKAFDSKQQAIDNL